MREYRIEREEKETNMNLKEAKTYFKKHPCRDLNGKWVAYDDDGLALGEVVYQKGIVVSKKVYKKKKK